MNKTKNAPASSAPASSGPSAFRVAYHDGPPNITFYNIAWQRGVPQAIAAEEWAGMIARADFKEFDFRLSPSTPDAPRSPLNTEE